MGRGEQQFFLQYFTVNCYSTLYVCTSYCGGGGCAGGISQAANAGRAGSSSARHTMSICAATAAGGHIEFFNAKSSQRHIAGAAFIEHRAACNTCGQCVTRNQN